MHKRSCLLLGFVLAGTCPSANAAETSGYATVTLYQSVGGVGGVSHDAFTADVASVDFFYVPANSAFSELSYQIVTQPAKGRAVDNGNGTFTFFLDTDFDSLAAGVSEVVSLQFRETHSNSQNDIFITVTGVAKAVTAPVVAAVVETRGDLNGDGAITTATGDALATPITSTFRPLAPVSAPPANVIVAAATDAQTTAQTADQTTGQSAPQSASSRFGGRGQSARAVLGSASAVAVSGVPNQTFAITLPGKTSFTTGQSSVNIAGFVHDAGATPAVSSDGLGVFNVGAQFTPASGGQTGAAENSAAGSNGVGSNGPGSNGATPGAGAAPQTSGTSAGSGASPAPAGPLVTSSPFVNITISYN